MYKRHEAGTRNELRRRYWAFALEYIHEMHGDASFSNVHPSKENWISGFFGVSGFSLNCVAKRSFADLIGKADYQCIRTQNYFTNNGGSVTFYNNCLLYTSGYAKAIKHKWNCEKWLRI